MKEAEHYFQKLTQALQEYPRSIPLLIVDLDILDFNMEVLKQSLRPGVAFRIVVKSLPSRGLLQYVMESMGTAKLMVFHQPFLSEIAAWDDPTIDILLGKPMPVKTAEYFYQNLPSTATFRPEKQVQWLIDTQERLQEYLLLAKRLGQRFRVNLEIDVGLHRGGFADLNSLRTALQTIEQHQDYLELAGLMGYDPHVVKLPKIIMTPQKAFRLANDFYAACIQLIKGEFSVLWREDLVFNGGGSPTVTWHANATSVLNEISAGSCLLKPTTFEIASLTDYRAACFIATPILKKFKGTRLPGSRLLSRVLEKVIPGHRHSFFIYGGYWKADYIYPKGTRENALFGSSTNQSMINTPTGAHLQVDDFVFLRPQQSEFVLLQFERILLYRKGALIGEWEPLPKN